MPEYYDRYSDFRENANMKPIPGISIPKLPSDKTDVYKKTVTRLDKLSQKYYNHPYGGWLILQANPEFGGLEFTIPDMSVLRIPFPYKNGVEGYINGVSKHQELYGK